MHGHAHGHTHGHTVTWRSVITIAHRVHFILQERSNITNFHDKLWKTSSDKISGNIFVCFWIYTNHADNTPTSSEKSYTSDVILTDQVIALVSHKRQKFHDTTMCPYTVRGNISGIYSQTMYVYFDIQIQQHVTENCCSYVLTSYNAYVIICFQVHPGRSGLGHSIEYILYVRVWHDVPTDSVLFLDPAWDWLLFLKQGLWEGVFLWGSVYLSSTPG